MDANKRIVGMDGGGNEIVATVRKYGPVLMLVNKESGKTVNMAPIKAPLTIESITKADAEKLFAFPKLLGRYNRYEVKLNRGKYGLYAKYGEENISLNALGNKDADSITLDDPVLRSAIKPDGEVSIYDFQRQLRQDPRWQYTNNAREEVSNSVQRVLKDFGFMG